MKLEITVARKHFIIATEDIDTDSGLPYTRIVMPEGIQIELRDKEPDR